MEQTIEQKELSPIDEVCKKFGYGFGWRRHNVLGKLIHEIGNLIDLKNPESVLIEERSSKCLQQDQISFRPEHYLLIIFFILLIYNNIKRLISKKKKILNIIV